MSRSNLTVKFKLDNLDKFSKSFRKRYKEENSDVFKGSVIEYITLGVINRKEVPDVDDAIILIKLGNMDCSDDQAFGILERALENDEYKERGLIGIFCDLCNDLYIDVPIGGSMKDAFKEIEEAINKKIDGKKQLKNMINNLSGLLNNINDNKVVSIEDAVKQAAETAEEKIKEEVEGNE